MAYTSTKPGTIARISVISIVMFILGISTQYYGIPGNVKRAIGRACSNRSSAVARNETKTHLTGRTYVVLILGQSNAGNYGASKSIGGQNTYAFSGNQLFPCHDPLPGAGGDGGSPWPGLAARLATLKLIDNVVIACLAQGSTTAQDWCPGGRLFQTAEHTIHELDRIGYPVSAVIWHQGESDALLRTTAGDYEDSLDAIIDGIRLTRCSAPIYVCQCSRVETGYVYEPVRLAQANVARNRRNVYAGVGTDCLDSTLRYDQIHFNQKGLATVANQMFQVILTTDPTLQRVTK